MEWGHLVKKMIYIEKRKKGQKSYVCDMAHFAPQIKNERGRNIELISMISIWTIVVCVFVLIGLFMNI